MIATLRRRLRCDHGFTLPEFVVGAALALGAVSMIGGFLMSSFHAGVFAEGQSATLNNVRNTMQQLEKELRGADSIEWAPSGACSTYSAGLCVVVGAQTPTGGFRPVRYTHDGTDLKRALYDSGSATWGEPQTVIERVTNTGSQPIFACDTQSTLLKVTVDLHIEPTPQSNPNLHVQTSLRPRNFASAAICP